MSTPLPVTTQTPPQAFASDQDIRWCPGCGDYAVLGLLQQTLADLGIPRERLVFVSGMGCAGRLPYYLETYGIQATQGRAPALATGLQLARPDLSVWLVLGDGDGWSAGGHHLMHALRRNVDLKVLLFNNEVHGLTRGQCAATARLGTRTVTTPLGSHEPPVSSVAWALAAGATFVARGIDVDYHHLADTLQAAARHRGAAFVEICQNCVVYNDGAFGHATDRVSKAEQVIYLEAGQPLLFGSERRLGLRLGKHWELETVTLTPRQTPAEAGIVFHDTSALNLAWMLARLRPPDAPEPLGIFRAVRQPTLTEQRGPVSVPTLAAVADWLRSGDGWTEDA